MTIREWSDEAQRWFIKRHDGVATNWFATENEAHCYEVGYECDGSQCPDPSTCPCCNSEGGCC